MKNLKLALVLPALAVFASCSQDPVEETVDQNVIEPGTEIPVNNAMVETANPNKPQGIQDVYFAGQKLPVETLEGEYIYQGDIMLPKSLTTSQEVKLVFEKGEKPTNKSTGRTSGRWPNNTVYYAIDSNLGNKTRVYDAIAHWESNTNVEFVERSTQANYVYFTNGSGCSSYVGMTGGKQNITLATSCSTGNAIHEIGHAVGLWHEQSRVDRTDYITINYNNIQSGREHNFKTYEEQGFDGKEFTSTLDFGSIMMYGSYSFSSNGQPTIVKKNGSTFNIQRNGLSSGDKTGINNMYPYSGGGSTVTQPVYENGQYYTVNGLRVLRYTDRWFYSTKYGWKLVEYRDGHWWYV